jgi:hypothetical protein
MLGKLREKINETLEDLIPLILQNFLVKAEDVIQEYVLEYPIYEEMKDLKEYKYFKHGKDLPEDADIRVRIVCQTMIHADKETLYDKNIKISPEELLFLFKNIDNNSEDFIENKITEIKTANQIKAVWRNFIKTKNKV